MSEPVSIFIVALTLANIFACLWLLWWTARNRGDATQPDGVPAKTGHVWDGDLEEYNNPLPRWWLGLFILTVLFGVGYLIYFPGLGSFAGTSGWTQVEEHAADVRKAQALLEQRLATLKGKGLDVLAADAQAMSLAKNLFAANCSLCHGSDGRGAKGFPNLADDDWLWGSDPVAVLASIGEGRHGMMPALGSALGEEGLNEAASYVFSLNGRQAPPDWIAAGKGRFDAVCAACHGIDAKGNPQLGAPNLTDDTWLHGGDLESIRTTIAGGRSSQMPAQLAALGETKVRLLAAYVLNLSAKSPAAGTAAVTSNERLATRGGNGDVAGH
jgi:cytochrome c oxidase cbb3-type subunit III